MNNPQVCYECNQVFDCKFKLPIVLKCGDSACFDCLIANANSKVFMCKICGFENVLNYVIIKDMPVNKALLQHIDSHIHKNNLLPNKRFDFDVKKQDLSKVSPFLPSSDMKCDRIECQNEKFVHENTVYKYCSVNCYNLDKPEEFQQRLTDVSFS